MAIIINQENTQITVSIHELTGIVSISQIEGDPDRDPFASVDSIGIHPHRIGELIKALQEMQKAVPKEKRKYQRFNYDINSFAPVCCTDNLWRYVNHELKLLTTGFRNREVLESYKDTFRFDSDNIETIRQRYTKEFNQK